MRPTRETVRKQNPGAVYFVSTQTAGRNPFFRHERWAQLMIATIEHYAPKNYGLHAYVVMPDHLHLLICPSETLEKSVQLIKGGFSFRAKRELNWKGEIWQAGFTDHRIRNEEDWNRHLEYIRGNPIEAQLTEDSVLYEYLGFPNSAFPQGLKPAQIESENVRAKARTLQNGAPILGNSLSDPHRQAEKITLAEIVKGTGSSPSEKAAFSAGASAPEGGKR